MTKKVLITDDVHPFLIEELKGMGFSCVFKPQISLKEVHQVIENYSGLIINSKIIVDKILLDKAVQLEFVARLGSGMEIVDKAYARIKGVKVISSPEGNRNAVAEQALGMLLSLSNKLLIGDREVRQKNWQREKNRGFEIMGKTIGLIGFGHTGRSFAKKLAGMEMKVLAYDKYKEDYTHPFSFVHESSLEEIQEKADILSFHLPLTEETHHLVDTTFLQKCKNKAIIINTSRGSVIDTRAIIEGLESGKISGACLDVFENEKPHTFSKEEHKLYDRLYALDNVVLMPHVAGWTQESKHRLAAVIIEKLKKSRAV